LYQLRLQKNWEKEDEETEEKYNEVLENRGHLTLSHRRQSVSSVQESRDGTIHDNFNLPPLITKVYIYLLKWHLKCL
jgi:hypothetical protein